jgi:hypothetical protein
MEMSRRGALAALGGAAAAAAGCDGMPAGDGMAAAAMPVLPETPCADPNWGADHLARIKRLAAGDIRPEDRNYPTCCMPPSRYTELRSVSNAARYFMQSRYEEQEWRARTIAQAIAVLNEYDKTGILRHLF